MTTSPICVSILILRKENGFIAKARMSGEVLRGCNNAEAFIFYRFSHHPLQHPHTGKLIN